MNYRKIVMMTIATLVQACASSPTTNIDNPQTLQRQIAGSSGANTQVAASAANNQSNISSNEKPSIDKQNVETGKQSNASLPVSCAKDEYKSFFEQFVRGKDNQGNEIRYTYTAAYIQVRDYQDPSKLLETMSRKNDEFSIDLRDYRWVQLVPSQVDNSPYTRLKLDIKKVDDKTFRVDYIKAQYQYSGVGTNQEESLVRTYGEPNAYIFEHRNGCWNLTQKLQSISRSQSEPTTDSQAAIEAVVKKNMDYAELRNILLKNGWFPLVSPKCKTNVGGTATVCDSSPEVNSCSGDGYCLMHFVHEADNVKMSITTYGRRWYVTQWSFSKFSSFR
jgi:hypothetical protein